MLKSELCFLSKSWASVLATPTYLLSYPGMVWKMSWLLAFALCLLPFFFLQTTQNWKGVAAVNKAVKSSVVPMFKIYMYVMIKKKSSTSRCHEDIYVCSYCSIRTIWEELDCGPLKGLMIILGNFCSNWMSHISAASMLLTVSNDHSNNCNVILFFVRLIDI